MTHHLRNTLAAVTIFLGSFLLFLVQPMMGNVLLPHYGGTSTVWVVCLCTFQVLLILGYAYAHYLRGRMFVHAHIALLVVSAVGLYVLPDAAISLVHSVAESYPMASIVLVLLITVALPYVLVGANSSLVQNLVAQDKNGYRLYAVGNAGSFFGLIGYPLLIETNLTLKSQIALYVSCMVIYALHLLGLLLAIRGRTVTAQKKSALISFKEKDTIKWLFLSAASCFLLDSFTTHLTMDVTPLPLLWCVILSIYLLTWVVAFTNRGSKIGQDLFPIVIILVIVATWHLHAITPSDHFAELTICLLLLFSGELFIHSRLFALRPNVESLTSYYFIIALGGAAGGVLSTIVAPLVFSFVAEYPLSLALLFSIGAFYGSKVVRKWGYRIDWWSVLLVVAVIGYFGWRNAHAVEGRLLAQFRNFYGTVRIDELNEMPGSGSFYFKSKGLYCNGTIHGVQLMNGGTLTAVPTTYYTPHGGGMAILQHPFRTSHRPIKVALLGMGLGTLSAYGEKDDLFRFFEINPTIADLATDERHFTFLKSSLAKTEVVINDARKALEKDTDKYDLIVIDVFSGDSIPPHMATKEAVSLYLNHLTQDGILAFHISNWHLDLKPLMKSIGREFHLEKLGVESSDAGNASSAIWVYFARRALPFSLDESCQTRIDFDTVVDMPMITDDFHPLIHYVIW